MEAVGNKILQSFRKKNGGIVEALVLVPADTATAWCHSLTRDGSVCLMTGRMPQEGQLSLWVGEAPAPSLVKVSLGGTLPYPTALFYFGPAERHAAFHAAFNKIKIGDAVCNVTVKREKK